MKSVNEILKEIKNEFNERKDEGCVVIENTVVLTGCDTENELSKAACLLEEVVKQIKNSRGVYEVAPAERYYGYGYHSSKIITSLRMIRKPCKEFLQLDNYLNKYTSVKSIKWSDVMKQNVCGKRNYCEVESEHLLYHDKKVCSEILSWLRKNKATTYNVVVSFKEDSYKSSGYREEREWDGYYDYYLVIELYTKKGNKLKTRGTFHVA